MQKYGRQKQHQNGYENPKVIPKSLGLWWESECHNGNKKRARQQAAAEIADELANSLQHAKGCHTGDIYIRQPSLKWDG